MKNVLVYGIFNVLHPGHIRLLRFASECGQHLTVAVQSDKSLNQPFTVPEIIRLDGIKSISYVNDAFITDKSIVDLVKQLKPDILVKGREFEGQNNEEDLILKEYGGELVFDSGETLYSSLEILKKELNASEPLSIHYPCAYSQRHGISGSELSEQLIDFSRLRVLVIGDLILDEYIFCDPLGMSQEDPTIVVTPIEQKLFLGGAGIVSAHAAGLGAKVNFLTVTGDDESSRKAQKMLDDFCVRAHFITDRHRPTTLKQRYRCKDKTLLRVSHLHQTDISQKLQEKIINRFEELIKETDLLVFSDFNYGCLPDRLVQKLTMLARKNNAYIVADSQCSSQLGDVSRFKNVDLLTPTEYEARVAMRDYSCGMVVLAEQLRKKTECTNILLKLGGDGVLIHAGDKNSKGDFLTDQVPALNQTPRDVAGAGDSMLIVSAMALCNGATIWQSALLGSLAAAIQVGRLGNKPLTQSELKKVINS